MPAWRAAAAGRSAPASFALRSNASKPPRKPSTPGTALDRMFQWSDNRTMAAPGRLDASGQLDALLSSLIAAGRPSSMSLPRQQGLENFTELAQWLAGPSSGPAGEDLMIAGPAGAVPVRVYRPGSAPPSPA